MIGCPHHTPARSGAYRNPLFGSLISPLSLARQARRNVGPDWLPGWSLGQARGVQGSPDWMPGWGLQPGWRHAIRARGPGSGDTKISAVSPEPGCRDARRVCGWTSIVVGVHVFFTHQGNQSSSQCSLALLTHASKHNAVACSQPGHGGPGSLMRARPVGEDNQSGPKILLGQLSVA